MKEVSYRTWNRGARVRKNQRKYPARKRGSLLLERLENRRLLAGLEGAVLAVEGNGDLQAEVAIATTDDQAIPDRAHVLVGADQTFVSDGDRSSWFIDTNTSGGAFAEVTGSWATYRAGATPGFDFLRLNQGNDHRLIPVTVSTTDQLLVEMTSFDRLWIDANKPLTEGPQGAWLAYRVTNPDLGADDTLSVANEVSIRFDGFDAASQRYNEAAYVTDDPLFVGPADAVRSIGSLADGESVTVYFYVDYSEAIDQITTNDSASSVSLDRANPLENFTANYALTVSSVETSAITFGGSVVTAELTSANAAGLVRSVTIGGEAQVGGTIEQHVVYSFGNNLGTWIMPASEAGFQDDAFRLVGIRVTGPDADNDGVIDNENVIDSRTGRPPVLADMNDHTYFHFLDFQGGGIDDLAVTFEWEVLAAGSSQTVTPWAGGRSGNEFKYRLTGEPQQGELKSGNIDPPGDVDPPVDDNDPPVDDNDPPVDPPTDDPDPPNEVGDDTDPPVDEFEPVVRVINDFDDAGFERTPGFLQFDDCIGHFNDDVTAATEGDGSESARWTFVDLDPGYYTVSVNWFTVGRELRATNAPFTISGMNGESAKTIRLNQQLLPGDYDESFVLLGVDWVSLDVFHVTGDTLVVELTNDADNWVVADAILIQSVRDPQLAAYDGAVMDPVERLSVSGSVVDFGTTLAGSPLTQQFTVVNLGGADLDLSHPTLPAGFTMVSPMDDLTLAPGESTLITIEFDALASSTGVVSLMSSDPLATPFEFTVTATVAEDRIVDDGDVGFSTRGTWVPYGGIGHKNDVLYSAAGTGADVTRWTFTDLTPDLPYELSATWQAHANRATNAPYRVYDGSVAPENLLAEIRINQRQQPGDGAREGSAWERLGYFVPTGVSSGTLVVTLADDADGYVIADAVALRQTPDAEILVSLDGNDLTDGAGRIDFGSTPVGVAVSRTITIRNVGSQTLALTDPPQVPAGFSTNGFGQTSLAPGASTTITLVLDATTAGAFGGAVILASNDADEGAFEFAIEAEVANLPPQVVDDGGAGYSQTGNWVAFGGIGFGSDVRYSAAGSGTDVARWTYTGLQRDMPYVISATWAAHSNRASDAPYRVYDGSVSPANLLGEVRLNQKVAPSDAMRGGVAWEEIGCFTPTSGTLIVTLADDANGYVIADAVELRTEPKPLIVVEFEGRQLADGQTTIDFGSTRLGESQTRAITVHNAGWQPLALGAFTAPVGYTVSTPSSPALAPGQSATLTVTQLADEAGMFTGGLSLNSNDGNGPFDLQVTGTVQAAPPQVIDDGDAGYNVVGNWISYGGIGHGADVRYSAGGIGADVATYTFDVTPGAEYRVSATWSAHANRASNAPYSVYDGAAVETNRLGGKAINQRVTPADFTDGGSAWQEIGRFVAGGSTLTVTLTDLANGYVIADAVRVELVRAPQPVAPTTSSLDETATLVATGVAPVIDSAENVAATSGAAGEPVDALLYATQSDSDDDAHTAHDQVFGSDELDDLLSPTLDV